VSGVNGLFISSWPSFLKLSMNADSNGRKAIDLVAGSANPAGAPGAAGTPAAGPGRGRGGPPAAGTSAAEIRTLQENAASRK